mmetsp:Transcript_21939/g.46116  ORF Transcript_21939/g.46116 Transcript_21939/m.46116 type:complete len:118 (-) Transcript_21939:1053-1406(-)
MVARRGLNALAVQCAKSYPSAAEVNRTLGGNFSTSQAFMGPPKRASNKPRNHCAKNARPALPAEMTRSITGPNAASPTAPLIIVRTRPKRSLNQPARGRGRIIPNSKAVALIQNPCS